MHGVVSGPTPTEGAMFTGSAGPATSAAPSAVQSAAYSVQPQQPMQYAPQFSNGAPMGVVSDGYMMMPDGRPPSTLDEYVLANMKENEMCGYKGCELDASVLGVAVHQLVCSCIALYLIGYFGRYAQGIIAAILICCCISCWTNGIGALGTILMNCCKFRGSSHRTGWVSLLIVGIALVFVAHLLVLSIAWRTFHFHWILIINFLMLPFEAYLAYQWLCLVRKSQMQMGLMPTYCEYM